MKRFYTLAVLALLLLTIGGSSAAHADPLNLVLLNPIQTASPGSTVTFYAEIYENGGNFVIINGDSFSVDAPISLDDSGLFNNFPQIFFPYDNYIDVLFTLDLPANIHPGLYTGSFTLLGGFGFYDVDPISTQSFNVIVPGTISAIPEPSSLLLLSTGILAIAGGCKRKWRTA